MGRRHIARLALPASRSGHEDGATGPPSAHRSTEEGVPKLALRSSSAPTEQQAPAGAPRGDLVEVPAPILSDNAAVCLDMVNGLPEDGGDNPVNSLRRTTPPSLHHSSRRASSLSPHDSSRHASVRYSSRNKMPSQSSSNAPTTTTDLKLSPGGNYHSAHESPRRQPTSQQDLAASVEQATMLKKVWGEEMRSIVREEIRAALADSTRHLFDDRPTGGLVDAGDFEQAMGTETLESRVPTTSKAISRMDSIRLAEKAADMSAEQYYTELEGDPAEVYKFIVHALPFACVRKCAKGLFHLYSRLGHVEGPLRTDCVSRVVDGKWFGGATALLMIMNCYFMVLNADADVQRFSREESENSEFAKIGEMVFLVLFSTELLLKLWRHRMYFWVNSDWKYNWLDFGLVIISAYFVLLSDVLASANPGWLRILRICKLAKLLRIVKLASTFKVLRTILTSLINSFGTLMYSLVLLVMILFLFALTFVQRTASFLEMEGASLNEEDMNALVAAFGSVEIAMVNLFMCMTGGNDWSVYYESLIPTGRFNMMIFLWFVAFTQIALLNIILGVFVDRAMKCMTVGPEELALEYIELERKHDHELSDIIHTVGDLNGDGKLNAREWQRALQQGEVAAYLEIMGLRIQNVIDFFHSLEDENGDVDIARFVRGCIRMKGAASSFDMNVMMREMQQLTGVLDERHQEIQQALMRLKAL